MIIFLSSIILSKPLLKISLVQIKPYVCDVAGPNVGSENRGLGLGCEAVGWILSQRCFGRIGHRAVLRRWWEIEESILEDNGLVYVLSIHFYLFTCIPIEQEETFSAIKHIFFVVPFLTHFEATLYLHLIRKIIQGFYFVYHSF